MGKKRYPNRAMPNYESLLNQRQYEAVTTSAKYVRVIAGAGSGKTRVLTYRIAYLISDRHVDPSRILAITFTNKAAQEMKERATKLVEGILGRKPILSLSTFHSFCARLLREEHAAFDYPAGFSIFDEDDKKRLLNSVATELDIKKKDPLYKAAIGYIDYKKGQGIYPEDISITKESFSSEKKCLEFYLLYETRKNACKALDFDDLLFYAVRVLANNPYIQEKWSNRFDHILVDEFQDTNDVQFRLMKLLTRPDTSVYVVGDPDQTIYTWRGANQGIILDFEKNYPGAVTVVLNENYRSTKNILKAANTLIAHNRKRVPKDLYSNGADGELVQVDVEPRADDEARWVARKIVEIGKQNLKEDGKPDYRKIAVLYRSSYMTRSLEMALKNSGIAYRIFGGLRFYERIEVKDLLAYFTLLVNPLDNVAFERIINTPKRGLGSKALDWVIYNAKVSGLSEYNFLKEVIEKEQDCPFSPRSVAALHKFYEVMERTKEEIAEGSEVYSSVLKRMAEDLGYYEYLTENEEPEENRVENVNALFDDVGRYVADNPDSTFEEYLQNVSLLSSQDDINDGNYVTLMTIHVAKGLEFDYVFVISMNDGAFPSHRSIEENGKEGEEEERRLAYVAFTRARKALFISSNNDYSYVTDSHATPSPFIAEAGLRVPKGGGYYGSQRNGFWEKGGARSIGPSRGAWKPDFAKKGDEFGDGPSYDPFDKLKKKEEKIEDKPVSNGIQDWQVGDRAHHEKFGDGTVINVINGTIVVVDFDSVGKKTLVATHPMLSRLFRKGGEA